MIFDDEKTFYSQNEIYDILEINKQSSDEEIKRSYKKLILKYHPDKNNDELAKEKFIKIQKAYKMLSNKKMPFFYSKNENIKNSINNTEILKKMNVFLNLFCNDNKFVEDINDCDYKNAFIYFINKHTKMNFYSKNNLNIVKYVDCDLIDRYNDVYQNVKIDRQTRKEININLSTKNKKNIYKGEGEIDNFGNKGNLIIYVKTINNQDFFCKNSDLYKSINCNINDEIMFDHIDGRKISVDKNDIFDEKYVLFTRMGLPKTSSNGENIRGDLLCEINYN